MVKKNQNNNVFSNYCFPYTGHRGSDDIILSRPRLHYTVFIRRRYGNVPFWPTVYTVPFSYPASNEDCFIRKYLSVYTMPFSYDNISVPFSYENGIV